MLRKLVFKSKLFSESTHRCASSVLVPQEILYIISTIDEFKRGC